MAGLTAGTKAKVDPCPGKRVVLLQGGFEPCVAHLNFMANHIKFCSCGQCRRGLRTASGSAMVRTVVRKNRRKVKQALRRGDEAERVVSVPYTD